MAWEIHVRQLLQQPVQQAVSYERAKDTLEFVENETKIYILFRTENFQEKTKKHVNFSKFEHKGDKAKKKDGWGCKTFHKVDWKSSKDHGNNLF